MNYTQRLIIRRLSALLREAEANGTLAALSDANLIYESKVREFVAAIERAASLNDK